MKGKSLFIIIFFLNFSCQKDLKKEAVLNTEETRKLVGLLSFEEMKLDSTFKFQPINDDYISIHDFNKLKNDKNPKTYYLVDYFSKQNNKGLIKSVFYKNDNGIVKIVKEEDKYNNPSGQSFLIYGYTYKNKDKFYRIDSIPTQELIKTNQDSLKKIIKEGEKEGGYLCGTAMKEVLERNFPRRHTFIDENEFVKVKKSIYLK